MTEPVTSEEIEDVLSSIRRLVSETPSIAIARETGDDEAEQGEEGNGRLVLTPAFRVPPEEENASESAAGNSEESGTEAAAGETAGAGEEPVASEEDQALRTAEDAAAEPVAEEGPAEEAEPSPPEDDVAEAGEVPESPAEQEAALFFHSRGRETRTEEADTAAPGQTEDQPPAEEAGMPGAGESPGDEVEALDWEDVPFEFKGAEHRAAEFDTLELTIAKLEAVVGSQEDEWEPDGSEELDEQTPDQMIDVPGAAREREEAGDSGQRAGNAAAGSAQEGAPGEERVAVGGGLAEEEDAILDEEALRDLVAEIVRQELQGPLGERITRNVRKLVRREIHRALSAREFE